MSNKRNGKTGGGFLNRMSTKIMNKQSDIAFKVQQMYAEHKFTQDYVAAQAANGEHNGDPMDVVFSNIMGDERVEKVPYKDDDSLVMLRFKGQNINFGWYVKPDLDEENPRVASYGWCDEAAYKNIKKHMNKVREREELHNDRLNYPGADGPDFDDYDDYDEPPF